MEILWDHLDERQWAGHMAPLAYVPLRQSWAFGEAMRGFGAKVSRVQICDAGQTVALAQVVQRRGLRVVTQGPVWLQERPEAERHRIIRHLARHLGLTMVTPMDALQGWGLLPLITPRSLAVWQIDRPVAELRAGLHGKWRNRLVKAEALVTPRALSDAALMQLITEEAQTRKTRGYTNLPGAMAQQWSGQKLALGWHSAGRLQAGMVFLIHEHTASYFLGWASPVARNTFAHGPILWQAAIALREKGVRMLDLGDVNTQTGASLARFKLGCGAGVQQLGASCLAVPFG